jgi:hypothetical protein
MKGYTTISLEPLQKKKMKVLKSGNQTYGDVVDRLVEDADLTEEEKEQLEELNED